MTERERRRQRERRYESSGSGAISVVDVSDHVARPACAAATRAIGTRYGEQLT
jgi:hypothetical protein